MDQNAELHPENDELLEKYLLELKSAPAAGETRERTLLPSLPAISGGLLPKGLPYDYPSFFNPQLFVTPSPIDTTMAERTDDHSPSHSTIDSPMEPPPLLRQHPPLLGAPPAVFNIYNSPYSALFGIPNGMQPLFLAPGMGIFPPNPPPTLQTPAPYRPDALRPIAKAEPHRRDESNPRSLKDKPIVFVQDKDGESAKPFRCPVEGCMRTYKYKGDLKTHVQNVHSDMPDLPDIISPPKKSKEGKRFPCPLDACPSGFKSKRDLGRHLRHKHPEYQSNEMDFIHWTKED